ncbi:hypothetical protein DPEC_G00204570 [Dallia pectoralis]|uniref:Uncharacterized protein n=1 Tax=Dallia pectoralis TaxID=75939 RepID=A0ACC2G4D4_DALPE|nr:hypothetical protein DPEC_G00204570 [Dallia pectoralis]
MQKEMSLKLEKAKLEATIDMLSLEKKRPLLWPKQRSWRQPSTAVIGAAVSFNSKRLLSTQFSVPGNMSLNRPTSKMKHNLHQHRKYSLKTSPGGYTQNQR